MSLHTFLYLVTGFAGQGVVLPILVTVAAMLALAGQPRAALWWTISVVTVLGLVLIAKIGFIPCGRYLPGLALRSPSGHAASALAVYGGLAVLMMRLTTRFWLKVGMLVLAVAVAVLISISRIRLGAHTPPEVLLGGLIGLLGPLILASRRDLLLPPFRLRWILLLIVPALLVLLLHDVEIGAEERIDELASQLSLLTGLCR